MVGGQGVVGDEERLIESRHLAQQVLQEGVVGDAPRAVVVPIRVGVLVEAEIVAETREPRELVEVHRPVVPPWKNAVRYPCRARVCPSALTRTLA